MALAERRGHAVERSGGCLLLSCVARAQACAREIARGGKKIVRHGGDVESVRARWDSMDSVHATGTSRL